ncbi:MAG: nitroreductase family protein [Subdoligranulum sp.]|nr:nitroreductase family protein [Subdoligranulum sp.]
MMEFLRTRRTYRRFEQRPVAPEILQECVDAARIASCGANRQTVKYIIVQSPEVVAAVQPLVHWAAYLPREQGNPKADEVPTAFIAVLQDENLPGANDMDAGLALGSLTAAAWAHGVGSCIMGAIDRPALTKLLALPEKMRLCCMVALGYPTHKSHLVEMQNGSVKYYLDEAGDYCVPKRPLSKVLLKTL